MGLLNGSKTPTQEKLEGEEMELKKIYADLYKKNKELAVDS
jgi:hypothetical protein